MMKAAGTAWEPQDYSGGPTTVDAEGGKGCKEKQNKLYKQNQSIYGNFQIDSTLTDMETVLAIISDKINEEKSIDSSKPLSR